MIDNIKGKQILITSTDVMMIQFLVPHVLYLLDNGANVDVACSKAEGYQNEGYKEKIKEMLPKSVSFYEIRTERTPFSIKNISGLIDLKSVLKNKKYDLIWTNEPVMGVMTRLAACNSRKQGSVVMYLAHGYHFFKGAPKKNWIYYPVEKFMSHYCDLITVINWEDFYFTKKHFKKPVHHIDGIGLCLDKYTQVQVDYKMKRKELGVKEDDILIVSVGELQHRKNHAVILRAIAGLNNSNLKYIICGRGELEDDLLRLARELQIDNQLQLLGHRYDIPEILAVADIFAHPSQREGLGIAAIEAMAAGLPLITSNIQGIKDYVVNEKNGFSYAPYDVEGFTDGLGKLVRDRELRKQFGKTNRECAKKYCIENSVEQLGSIIADALR